MAKPLIFLGVDLNKVQWIFVAYIIVCIAIVGGGTSMLYPSGISRAVIFAIGSLLTVIFYGYRWFGGQKAASNVWPPTMNTCPDFLTYVPTLPGDKKPGCVDLLGVSNNGALQLTMPTAVQSGSLASTDKARVVPFTADTFKATTDVSVVKAMCSYCAQKGITWEGVWDGTTCTGISVLKAQIAASGKGSCSA